VCVRALPVSGTSNDLSLPRQDGLPPTRSHQTDSGSGHGPASDLRRPTTNVNADPSQLPIYCSDDVDDATGAGHGDNSITAINARATRNHIVRYRTSRV